MVGPHLTKFLPITKRQSTKFISCLEQSATRRGTPTSSVGVMRGRKPSVPGAPRPLPNSGDEIEVYWAGDRRYYPGKIGNFDPNTNTFRVEYVDGDVENLDLNTERWPMRDENPNFQRTQEQRQTAVVNPDNASVEQSKSMSPAKRPPAVHRPTAHPKSAAAPIASGPPAKSAATPNVSPPPNTVDNKSSVKRTPSTPVPIAPSTFLSREPLPLRTAATQPQTVMTSTPKVLVRVSGPMTKPTSTPVPPIANPANPVRPNSNPTRAQPPAGLSVTNRNQPENPTPVLNIPVATSNTSTHVGSTATVQSGTAIRSAVEIEGLPHHGPPIPPQLPPLSNPAAPVIVTRPAQSDPSTLIGKKRKHSPDSNGDIQATSPSSPEQNNGLPAIVPRSTAPMTMSRNGQNNQSLPGQSARLPFVPPMAKRARPVPVSDKRVRKLTTRPVPDSVPSVSLMARYAADAARIVAMKETGPVTKEIGSMRETMKQWSKDHAGVAESLDRFARKQTAVLESSTNAMRDAEKAAGFDVMLEKKLQKYFSVQAKQNEELMGRITKLEEELEKSNSKINEYYTNASTSTSSTPGILDAKLSQQLLEHARQTSTLIEKELKEIAGVTRSVTGTELQKEVSKFFKHVLEPRIRDLVAEEVMKSKTLFSTEGSPGAGNTISSPRELHVPSIAQTLVSRSATVWLLEDTERSPPPSANAELAVWRRDCCTRCFKSVVNTLKSFETADTALRVLKAASHDDISFAWFFEPGVESNVQLARANYNAWDPPLTNEEWDAEAGVLRELSRRYAAAQNCTRINSENDLEVAISVTQAAVDID